jgi:SAM-dependent methyltransferase
LKTLPERPIATSLANAALKPGLEKQMNALTEVKFWDQYWSHISLPLEMARGRSLYLDEILGVFDRYLPHDKRMSVLEIGGAPGQYIAYLYRQYGIEPNVLDNSPIGCQKTVENFRLLAIPGKAHLGDMFDSNLALPQFDIVFSLGLIEHFQDLEKVVSAHLQFLKPGGILVLGCPNFLGINGVFLKRLMPELVSIHNLSTMRLKRWRPFEKRFGLVPVFRGYVGGFEPRLFARTEHKSHRVPRMVARASAILGKILNLRPLAFLRKFNSSLWSGYVMGVYRYPGEG